MYFRTSLGVPERQSAASSPRCLTENNPREKEARRYSIAIGVDPSPEPGGDTQPRESRLKTAKPSPIAAGERSASASGTDARAKLLSKLFEGSWASVAARFVTLATVYQTPSRLYSCSAAIAFAASGSRSGLVGIGNVIQSVNSPYQSLSRAGISA